MNQRWVLAFGKRPRGICFFSPFLPFYIPAIMHDIPHQQRLQSIPLLSFFSIVLQVCLIMINSSSQSSSSSFTFPKVMRGQFLRFISILHILNLVCITNCRPFVPNGGHFSALGKCFPPSSCLSPTPWLKKEQMHLFFDPFLFIYLINHIRGCYYLLVLIITPFMISGRAVQSQPQPFSDKPELRQGLHLIYQTTLLLLFVVLVNLSTSSIY